MLLTCMLVLNLNLSVSFLIEELRTHCAPSPWLHLLLVYYVHACHNVLNYFTVTVYVL